MKRKDGVSAKKPTSLTGLRLTRTRVQLAASEPQVLKNIREESKRKGTSSLTSLKIDAIIKAARAQTKNR